MNYMAEVAKMLGVEVGEEFEVHGDPRGIFTAKITLDGCCMSVGMKGLENHNQTALLINLLKGKYSVKRKPRKPQYSEKYYCVNTTGHVCEEQWYGDFLDMLYYKLGNCYMDRSQAEANRDKWISFYASDAVLEV